MRSIPPTSFPRLSAAPRIVVSETVEARVPNWPIVLNDGSFRKIDPSSNNREVPVHEVLNLQILCFGYRSLVFSNSSLQCPGSHVSLIATP